MKKITYLLLMLICITTHAQMTDFVSGIDGPERLLVSGNNLYVKTETNISVIDVSAQTPTATIIYSKPNNEETYIANFTMSGTNMYIALETINEEHTETLGSAISRLDLTNPSAGVTTLYTSLPNYINALTVSGNTIFFTSEVEIEGEIFSSLYSFDSTILNPIPSLIVDKQFGIVEDLVFNNNIIYVSDRDKGKVFGINATSGAPVSVTNESELSFNKGIFVNNNELYVTDSHRVKKASDLTGSTISLTQVGENTTYQESNGGPLFLSNFRDVALIGNTMYLALKDQELIVKIDDATLSNKTFSSEELSLLNDNSKLVLNGLDSKQLVSVYNLLGQSVINAEISTSSNTIDITSLKAGVYVLKLNESGTSIKFLKK